MKNNNNNKEKSSLLTRADKPSSYLLLLLRGLTHHRQNSFTQYAIARRRSDPPAAARLVVSHLRLTSPSGRRRRPLLRPVRGSVDPPLTHLDVARLSSLMHKVCRRMVGRSVASVGLVPSPTCSMPAAVFSLPPLAGVIGWVRFLWYCGFFFLNGP